MAAARRGGWWGGDAACSRAVSLWTAGQRAGRSSVHPRHLQGRGFLQAWHSSPWDTGGGRAGHRYDAFENQLVCSSTRAAAESLPSLLPGRHGVSQVQKSVSSAPRESGKDASVVIRRVVITSFGAGYAAESAADHVKHVHALHLMVSEASDLPESLSRAAPTGSVRAK